ncbi:methyl-accepting chemotaxis protein [Actinoplanes sp. HUAS TT8]|uniref:methyl-accepting chemotaxis protein n=1 Tax=Actinoplanes sp. HUAS TT8 TaxID=3447453 RepID=UPI003F51C7F6
MLTEHRNPLLGWFADRRVRSKILSTVALVALMGGVITAVAVSRMNSLNESLREIESRNVESLARLSDVRGELALVYSATLTFASVTDKALKAQTVERVNTLTAEVDSKFTEYQKTMATSTGAQQHATDFLTSWGRYKQMRAVVIFGEVPTADLNLPSGTAAVVAEFRTTVETYNTALDELANDERAAAKSITGDSIKGNSSARTLLIVLLLIAFVIAAALALGVARAIVGPLQEVSRALRSVADGDLTRTVPIRSRDEVGEMAISVNQASTSVRQAVSELATSADALAASSDELSKVSNQIATGAGEASAQANNVSAAAGEVSRNVQTVAAGSQEMGASISEIAQNASAGAAVAVEAVTVAEATNATVGKLGESSAEIGEVIKTITSIAEQTNLLALNATIEAARAGDMGKGFAVVAGEVKDLAQETAKATEDISRRVEAIQADTGSAVEAIAKISTIIGRINNYQLTIASAVEEQTATTTEMNRNVADAAESSAQIAATIQALAHASHATAEGVADSQRAAANLASLSTDLHTLVSRFRY